MELDRTPGYVNQLSTALNGLTNAVTTASTASDRHARSLVRASWTLAAVTVVLVMVTAISVAGPWLERSPEEQARREVDRCTALARTMMGRIMDQPPENLTERDLQGYTMTCLLGRR